MFLIYPESFKLFLIKEAVPDINLWHGHRAQAINIGRFFLRKITS
jgi:hypothetical protein